LRLRTLLHMPLCFVMIMLHSSYALQNRRSIGTPSETFTALQVQFGENVSQLHKTLERGEKGNKILYRTKDVNELLRQTEKRILEAVPDDNVPLQRYIDHGFPSSLPTSPNGFALEPDVIRVAAEVNAVFKKLESLSAFRFDLTVSSKPSEAAFELISSVGPSIKTTTNDTLTNIYRGEYDYQLTKAGYKPIRETINFIDRAGTQLDCVLKSASSRAEALPCRLR
jgi:hypothetical protein